ncbi:hypothetical protein [Micromonospora craniellae]|uniref:hypothetical protein n=1 Tax=Micromonospora craniellae TaxID=2294034 RepID=UPI00168BA77B|nr:hypothetical protein [Micromonospora craniellae]QOC92002.1 hypothetical protein ID554_29735 [Micromonospora craniellae]
MSSHGDTARQNAAEQIQQVERETAKQRILAMAEAERIPVEETTRALPEGRWRRGE